MSDTNEFPDLVGIELECCEALTPFVVTMMIADEQLLRINYVFLNIADSVMAFDQNHKRIMNIIMHSLSDYNDKPYK